MCGLWWSVSTRVCWRAVAIDHGVIVGSCTEGLLREGRHDPPAASQRRRICNRLNQQSVAIVFGCANNGACCDKRVSV
jgi:hypothetical protein